MAKKVDVFLSPRHVMLICKTWLRNSYMFIAPAGRFCDGGRTGSSHGAWAELQRLVWFSALLHGGQSQQAGGPGCSAETVQSQQGNHSLFWAHTRMDLVQIQYEGCLDTICGHVVISVYTTPFTRSISSTSVAPLLQSALPALLYLDKK